MPYLGNAPATQFSTVEYQDLTGGTGTSHTLDHPVSSANELEVFIGNVRQEPGVAYTAGGTTLTLTTAVTASDDFYVVFQGKTVGTVDIPQKQSGGDYNFDNAVGITGNFPIWENVQTVNADYTITNNRNAMSAGPITVASGVTVTVGSGETWTVV